MQLLFFVARKIFVAIPNYSFPVNFNYRFYGQNSVPRYLTGNPKAEIQSKISFEIQNPFAKTKNTHKTSSINEKRLSKPHPPTNFFLNQSKFNFHLQNT